MVLCIWYGVVYMVCCVPCMVWLVLCDMMWCGVYVMVHGNCHMAVLNARSKDISTFNSIEQNLSTWTFATIGIKCQCNVIVKI